MDCRVVVEGAVPVYDVETPDEAVRIAISKTGGMLNPDLSYVEIEPADRTAPDGSECPAALVAADEALVALEFELAVFNVETAEHADRIARSELGGALEDIPLTVEAVETTAEEATSEEATADDESDSEGTETTSETMSDDDETTADGDTTTADGDETTSATDETAADDDTSDGATAFDDDGPPGP